MNFSAPGHESYSTLERLGPWIGSIGLLVAFVAAILVLLAWRNGRLAHDERMKAMELGLQMTPRVSSWPVAIYCAAVGVGIPTGTFLLTWLGSQSDRAPQDLWVAPSVVSVAALIGTSVVAGISFFQAGRSSRREDSPTPVGKPAADADALDFSGRLRRG